MAKQYGLDRELKCGLVHLMVQSAWQNRYASTLNSNYDSSINADDGRLNFDSGDLTAGTLKIVTDIEADFGMARGFASVRGFYDAVLDSDSSFERSGINEDGEAEAIMHINVLLDAYIDVDTDIADMPVLVRVGRK